MKRFTVFLLALGLLFAAGTAAAFSKSDNASKRRVIPLLVHVSKEGKVTDVSPAYELRPSMQRHLRQLLKKMITKPALDHGKPVSSQFVVNLALIPVPRPDGKYGLTVKYVSSKPLPAGEWYWTHTENHRLALANQQGAQFQPQSRYINPNRDAQDPFSKYQGVPQGGSSQGK